MVEEVTDPVFGQGKKIVPSGRGRSWGKAGHHPDFWERVNITDDPDDCWEWTGPRSPAGYGYASPPQGIGDKSRLAHRRAYVLVYDSIEPNILVCHRCDNPPCCNPLHLFVGTHRDNMDDMVRKNRIRHKGRPTRE